MDIRKFICTIRFYFTREKRYYYYKILNISDIKTKSLKIHESFMKYITWLSMVEGINMENSGWLRTGERDSRKDKTLKRKL